MLAKRIPTILPKLTFEESLEVTKIHSIAGNLSEDIPIISTRPFRNPHHTISKSSLIGGGKIPKPGEVSLAHNGVLFLDELPEFTKDALEVLRVPIEDGKVTLSRVLSTVTYPCNFMLITSMNPCMCGYYGSDKQCKCTEESIRRYIGRISGPMLDRIDIQIEVNSVKYDKFTSSEYIENSNEIRKRVNFSREIQQERYKNCGIFSNAELTPKLIEKYCKLDKESKNILESAFNRLGLSSRAHERILKVSRTIADIEGKENIEKSHILEAISYRSLDKKYWRA